MLLSQINSFKFGSAFAFLSSGTDEVVSSDLLHKSLQTECHPNYSKMIIPLGVFPIAVGTTPF